jgi:hypothetical protein
MPRKVFTAGDVLTAADVNTFLMDQSVMTFATVAARNTAIPSPTAGMTVYIADIAQIQYYNGTAWVQVGSGSGGGFQNTFLLMGA